jgi:hypothetical protein
MVGAGAAALTAAAAVVWNNVILDAYKAVKDMVAGWSRGDGISSLPLTDAIQACTRGKDKINEMRIFAPTTGVILPIIEGSKFNINTCYILLPRFVDPASGTREAQTNDRCEAGWTAGTSQRRRTDQKRSQR